MSDYGTSEKIFCKYCGSENRKDAEFCKKCGKTLGIYKNKIERINEKINILAVTIGIAVAILFLFISSALFGTLLAQGKINIILYYGMVFATMLFFGGLTTGLLVCKNYSDAIINGGFLTLIALINIGFIVGIFWLSAVGIVSSIASAFHTPSTTGIPNPSLTNTTPSTSVSPESIYISIEIISMIILVLLIGIFGSMVGVFIKNSFK